MRSFDFFDTLAARLYLDPFSVFRLVEEKYPFPNFVQLRRQAAQMSNGTLVDIYQHFSNLSGISQSEADHLLQFEWEMEKAHLIPIQKNLQLVQDGDLIISDTYYTQSQIEELLRLIGCTKKVVVFATPAGKASGAIWLQMRLTFSIEKHLGDNLHSDVLAPTQFGISAELCTNSDLTPLEKQAFDAGQKDLSLLIRTLRLINPYSRREMPGALWQEQVSHTIPIYILFALYLHEYCQQHQIQKILFSSRDCESLASIFSALFPSYHSLYFHCSRVVYSHPTQEYIDYVKSVYHPNCLIVDGFGSGMSCTNFFQKHFQCTPKYLAMIASAPQTQGAIHWPGRTKWEMLNYSDQGSLIGFDKTGPIRLPSEYREISLKPAYDCLSACLKYLPHFQFSTCNANLMNLWHNNLQTTNLQLEFFYVQNHLAKYLEQQVSAYINHTTPLFMSASESLRIAQAIQHIAPDLPLAARNFIRDVHK